MAGKTKKFLVISLALSLIFLSATAGMAEKKTLTVGTFAWIIKKFPSRDITEKFMRDHPDVKVNIQTLPIADFVPKLLTDWKRGKTEVDIVIGGNPGLIAPAVGADLLLDLSDMFTGHMAKDKFVTAFLKDGRFAKNGKLYYPVITFMGELTAIPANKRLYKQAGVIRTRFFCERV